jgi:hypothetical protein
LCGTDNILKSPSCIEVNECMLYYLGIIARIWFVCMMVFNATFNNISVTSWLLVVLVEETEGPGENHRPVASHSQTLSHNDFFLSEYKCSYHSSIRYDI